MHVFFVSTFGHIFHALRLIELKKYDNSKIVFVIITSDRKLAANMKIKLKELKYKNIERIISWMPLYRMAPLKNLKNKVIEIVDKYNPLTFNTCVFEIFYGVIGDIARERNIKLILFEEGLGSYKFLYNYRTSFIKEVFNGLIVCTSYFFKNFFARVASTIKAVFNLLYKNTKRIIKLALVATPKVFIKSLSLDNQNKIRRLLYSSEFKNTTKPVLDYDEVYLTYPNKVKGVFNAKKYKKLPLRYKLTDIEKKEIQNSNYKFVNKDSIIFVNQRYIGDYRRHFDFVLEYLKGLNSKVFIKLHPRENEESIKIINELIKEKNLDNIAILNNNVLIPLEKIIQYRKPRKVVGFASSVLLYTKTISPKTEIISCVPEYINEFKKDRKFKKELDKLWSHYNILKETLKNK